MDYRTIDSWNTSSRIQKEFGTRISRGSLYIEMPYLTIKDKLRKAGYIKRDRPCSRAGLTYLADSDIIQHYAYVARGLMAFYRCVDNK